MKKAKITESDFSKLLNILLEQITDVPFEDFKQDYSRSIETMKSVDEEDTPFLAVGLALKLEGLRTERPTFSQDGSYTGLQHR